MKLKELLTGFSYRMVSGNVETEVTELMFDSRKTIVPGAVFVCISGAVHDGHSYAADAVAAGASAIIAEHELELPEGVCQIVCENTREALACMSAAYFGHPAKELVTIGITGTKGKTTTAYMIRNTLELAGYKTGLIGTIEAIVGETHIPSNNTTPESYFVQKYFRDMVNAGCKCVVMEVSSQGLMLHRVSGFVFDYGIFTNLSPDHIGGNEHKDFEDYLQCKSRLFKQCRVGIANRDDEHMEKVLAGHTCELETYGMKDGADLQAVNVDLHNKEGELLVSYTTKGTVELDVTVGVPGKFTVYNSLTAIAVCRHFNIPEEMMQQALRAVKVKGRVEPVEVSNRFTVMIDYAHNAMSLQSLLTTLADYHPKRIVCLFGCGGNRSRDRRFEMGEISSEYADVTVITSDNPRTESPEAIMEDILTGVKKRNGEYVMIRDRKEAIRYCILHAQEGDVIVLAGKGHEDYQEINGVKYPMDERILIREILEEMSEEERKAL
ncbi:MAG: UDP-N-acetylmuramoyl-L-alanyl-D-glutamate--2,6-diaminopimelate ligase [Lachnospiraceae bacterium]|nr:UDP-N-acetylmuramoyl-L-alanyl-D-glutamate--2,6-diaminopimelate ligase [Lachnospiraceae bacterium]